MALRILLLGAVLLAAWLARTATAMDPVIAGDTPYLLPPAQSEAVIAPVYADPTLYSDVAPESEVLLAPDSQLWLPPIANQREPRLYAKSLTVDDQSTLDTAIGLTVPIVRWYPAFLPVDAAQLDMFAVAFFRIFDANEVAASDGRVGFLYTWQKASWTGKIGYEHLSSHLIDEYIDRTGELNEKNYSRDEITFGVAYQPGDIRWYGQMGIPVRTAQFESLQGEEVTSGLRFDTGLEWQSCALACWMGNPFAAVDVEVREEQAYQPNVTAQFGWQFPAGCRSGPRVALEGYSGRSPFGQFLFEHESWLALGIYVDR